jgi:hypothetical protein
MSPGLSIFPAVKVAEAEMIAIHCEINVISPRRKNSACIDARLQIMAIFT